MNRLLPSILLLLVTSGGCAFVTHKPITYTSYPDDGDNAAGREAARQANNAEDSKLTDGIHYYLSSPYLLVYSDGKGNLSWKVHYLPDLTKPMVATPHQFFAKTTNTFSFVNGVLTTSKSEADSTAVMKAVIGAVEKVLPLLLLTENTRDRTTVLAPRLYKIIVEQERLTLVGVPSKETVSISLKPGT